ncbi:acetate/propionate family kinase [Parvibacter caecicola]|uniref:Acetate kinase n=1 Tax=Parvibacter caecicola TaxID=747645 RepID=A0A7W5GPI8_9ACTN|nr:acetate kinase [Parvibacter caecicola]MBB3171390.1 acetate kinase [Parvibacter caecicola]MCR2041265.1 acetate kinase [Parvibacter caecicola]RNL08873.1 acetate kinase [Parvibacter caecicola]
MKVLVLNAGSSSLKYQLLDLATGAVLIRGLCENIGMHDSAHRFDRGFGELKRSEIMNDHHDALQIVINTLLEPDRGPIKSLDEIDAVGHRVVSGGEYFTESTLIDDDVLEKIGICSELAPLHNPPALAAMHACLEMMPGKPEVAVFDTAFFQTLPPRAYVYPLPYEYYTDYKIRKYGAHGTSHRFIARHAAKMLGADVRDLRLITCHLGNGASIAAVDHGVAIDTTMGLTPLDGLMMGTRCGTIDPAVVTRIQTLLGYTPDQMNEIMNKKSGLLGVSGISSDLRTVEEAALAGNERAVLALELYAYFIKRYIGQYFAVMGGADAIVFTAGVGENSEYMRAQCLAGLEPMGIVLDARKNRIRSGERIISEDRSRVKIMVIPTNEELMIARDVEKIMDEMHQAEVTAEMVEETLV